MFSDKVRFFAQILKFIVPYAFTLIGQRLLAVIHKHTYKTRPISETKNVVVIGGSFAGFQLARRLTETLPSGYRVVLVEKNSHLNYLFTFPRFSVVKGYEQYAFIPYTGLTRSAPNGIFCHIQDTAIEIKENSVSLSRGEKLEYEYLIIATGTSSSIPSKVISTDREGGQEELRGMQDKIAEAKTIAIVGGGAVGVELASDIKSVFPEKDVTLVHSRGQLLQSFGERLHEHAMEKLKEMGIVVLLNERPNISDVCNTLELLDGKKEDFDLIIPCIGQQPNSSIIASISPTSISKTSHILVKPTLQLLDDALPRIFAFGDVAETGGPKMGRASYLQSEIVCQNVLSLIKRKDVAREYKPNLPFEGSIKLTLGTTHCVMWMRQGNERQILMPLNGGKMDLDVKKQWGFFGADVSQVKHTAAKARKDTPGL